MLAKVDIPCQRSSLHGDPQLIQVVGMESRQRRPPIPTKFTNLIILFQGGDLSFLG